MFDRASISECDGYPVFYEDMSGATDASWWDTVDDATWQLSIRRQKAGQFHKVESFVVPIVEQFGFSRDNVRILSVGCGMAFDVLRLKELGYHAVGTDFGGRTKVWKEAGLAGTDVFISDARDLPINPETFDVVFLWHVIEHFGTSDGNQIVESDVDDVRFPIVEKLRKILKNGGLLIIGTPNRLFPLDQYHGAHLYLPPGFRAWCLRHSLGIHYPWSKRDFLLSRRQLEHLLRGYSEIRWYPASKGMALRKGEFLKTSPMGKLGTLLEWYVSVVDKAGLYTSPLSPVLHLVAVK